MSGSVTMNNDPATKLKNFFPVISMQKNDYQRQTKSTPNS